MAPDQHPLRRSIPNFSISHPTIARIYNLISDASPSFVVHGCACTWKAVAVGGKRAGEIILHIIIPHFIHNFAYHHPPFYTQFRISSSPILYTILHIIPHFIHNILYTAVVPLKCRHVLSSGQDTGTIAGTGNNPHTATLVIPICAKIFHRHYYGGP